MAQTDIETIDKLPIPKINAKSNKFFSRNGDLLLFLNANGERKVQFNSTSRDQKTSAPIRFYTKT